VNPYYLLQRGLKRDFPSIPASLKREMLYTPESTAGRREDEQLLLTVRREAMMPFQADFSLLFGWAALYAYILP